MTIYRSVSPENEQITDSSKLLDQWISISMKMTHLECDTYLYQVTVDGNIIQSKHLENPKTSNGEQDWYHYRL